MKKFKNVLIFIFLLSILTKFVNCDCTLKISETLRTKPVFKKQLGSWLLKISKQDNNGIIHLHEGEHLTAYCATKLNPIEYIGKYLYEPNPNDYYNYYPTTTTQRSVKIIEGLRNKTLTCSSGKIEVFPLETLVYERSLSCEDYKWKIFETKKPLPWCSTQAMSYILAINSEVQNILGALCFNLNEMILESINYVTQEKNFTLTQEMPEISYPANLNIDLLGMEVIGFDNIFRNYDESPSKNVKELADLSHNLLEVAVYKDDTILQSYLNNELFDNYQNLLKISWWHNLKYGNWKRFRNAFDERSQDIKYNVFMGTSGKIKLPKAKLCDGKETGEFKLQTYNSSTPAYIWAYLQAIDKNEEFVFISYNSPFYEFFNSTDIIFCDDICNEISWLNNLRSTFRYSSFGVSFCCSPESVRNSNVLNGFPRIYKPSELIVETTTPVPIISKFLTTPTTTENIYLINNEDVNDEDEDENDNDENEDEDENEENDYNET